MFKNHRGIPKFVKPELRQCCQNKKNQASASAPAPAPVKAVELSCVTCGVWPFLTKVQPLHGNVYRGTTFRVCVHKAVQLITNHNVSSNFRPQMVANVILDLPFSPVQNSQANMLNNFNRGNNFNQNGRAISTKQRDTPLVTQFTNPKRRLKGITTRSGVDIQGPPIPTSSVGSQYPREMSFEIELYGCSCLMPKLASTLRTLLGNKEKRTEVDELPNEPCLARTSMNEIVRRSFLKQVTQKKFENPRQSGEKLSLPDLTPTCRHSNLRIDQFSKPWELQINLPNSSVDEPTEVELKELPPHLEYAFLEGDNKLPVIIAKEVSTRKFCNPQDSYGETMHQSPTSKKRKSKIHDVIKKEVENFSKWFEFTLSPTVPWFARYLSTRREEWTVLTSIYEKRQVHTDHSALKYLFAKKGAKGEMLRWVLLPHEFDVKVMDTKERETRSVSSVPGLEKPKPRGLPDFAILQRGLVHCEGHVDPAGRKTSFSKMLNTISGTTLLLVLNMWDQVIRRRVHGNEALEILEASTMDPQRVIMKYELTHLLSTAYHQNQVGKVEVSNRGLKRILERTLGENRASCLVYGKGQAIFPIELEHKGLMGFKASKLPSIIARNKEGSMTPRSRTAFSTSDWPDLEDSQFCHSSSVSHLPAQLGIRYPNLSTKFYLLVTS
ncbi:hypothetical protein Tco_0439412 [Tanacetum coccineum]